jgi:hypothetical protein
LVDEKRGNRKFSARGSFYRRARALLLQLESALTFVIARFMRATQFSVGNKIGCPDKPGNDDVEVFQLGKIWL